MIKRVITWATVATLALNGATAFGHCCPSAGGGGLSTLSGETLAPTKYSLTIQSDVTEFENIQLEEAKRRAAAAEGHHFDALTRAYLNTATVNVGIWEGVEASARLGWYHGEDYINAMSMGSMGRVMAVTGDPDGLTDLTLMAKVRLLRLDTYSFSGLFGLKIPTGRTEEGLTNNHALSVACTPGSGSWDVPLGVAGTWRPAEGWIVDQSLLYTLKNPYEGTQIGDQISLSGALSRHLLTFSGVQVWAFGETTWIWNEKDTENALVHPNTGGNALWLGGGLRLKFGDQWSLAVGPSVPVFQQVNGDQQLAEWRATAALSFSY